MSIRINIGATFDAKDIKNARRELEALERQLEESATGFGRINRGLRNFSQGAFAVGSALTSSVTVPILGAGGAAVTAAANFSQSMSRITSLVGIAAGQVLGMEEAVLDLSRETAKAPVELADALFVVTSAGLRGESALEALEVAAKASAAGLGTTADIARAVAGAINAYGEDTLDAARATDIVVATARAGNFETTQFAAALGRVLPFAQQAQASLEDVGGAVALLTRTNGNAAESITAVQALFRAFVVPTEEAKTILDEVGLSARELRTQMGHEGLVSTLRTLDRALRGNREVLGRMLGSTEAASAAFQILNSDANTIAETFGVVGDSAGITGEAFEVAADEPLFKFQQALNELQIAAIDLGNELLPVVTDMTESLSELVAKFSDLSDAQQDLVIKGGALLAVLGPLGIALGGVARFVGIIGQAIPYIATAFGAIASAVAFIAGAPLVALAAGIGAVIGGGVLLSRRNEDVARTTGDVSDAQDFAGLVGEELAKRQAALARQQEYQARQSERQAEAARLQSEMFADLEISTIELNDEMEDSGPIVVRLNREMRDLLQRLNDTYVGLGETQDALAEYAREVLAAGVMTEDTKREIEQLAGALRSELENALADAEYRLGSAQQAFENYSESIAGGIRQGNTLADAAARQSDAMRRLSEAQDAYVKAQEKGDPDQIAKTKKELEDAEAAQGSFNDFLQQNVMTAEQFAGQVNRLREAGASLAVLQQITQLGAETGGRIIAELLAGGAEAIKQANRLTAAVEAAATDAGNMAAQKFYGAGVRAAQAMVDGLRSELQQLDDVLAEIIAKIDAAFAGVGGRSSGGGSTSVDPTPQPMPSSPYARTYTPRAQPRRAAAMSNILTRAGFAEGGFVTGAEPIFGMLGEAGPEVIIPLDRMGDFGGPTVVNVTVTSADPQSVVEAIRRYTRNNGPLGGVVSL